MTTLRITIDLDNAAFEDGELDEVLDIIDQLADYWGQPAGSLRDSNGNTVGTFEVTE